MLHVTRSYICTCTLWLVKFPWVKREQKDLISFSSPLKTMNSTADDNLPLEEKGETSQTSRPTPVCVSSCPFLIRRLLVRVQPGDAGSSPGPGCCNFSVTCAPSYHLWRQLLSRSASQWEFHLSHVGSVSPLRISSHRQPSGANQHTSSDLRIKRRLCQFCHSVGPSAVAQRIVSPTRSLKHPQICLRLPTVVHLTPFGVSFFFFFLFSPSVSIIVSPSLSVPLQGLCLSVSLPLTLNLPSVQSSDRKS